MDFKVWPDIVLKEDVENLFTDDLLCFEKIIVLGLTGFI